MPCAEVAETARLICVARANPCGTRSPHETRLCGFDVRNSFAFSNRGTWKALRLRRTGFGS